MRSAEIRSVAEQLKSGSLTAEQAVETIARQAAERVGAALTGTAMLELEGMLKDLTRSDPYLAGKLAKLKKTK